MFTGLIEAVGQVETVEPHAEGGKRFKISVPTDWLSELKAGDSIAIDGVCTTATAFEDNAFWLDASLETLSKTTFQWLQAEQGVNLERPLLPHSRLGGHFVSGHVDGMARLVFQQQEGNARTLVFELADEQLTSYFVDKGSVAVSGISLTVNRTEGKTFWVAIIPHTMEHTTVGQWQLGDWVNIETDILGKYVNKLMAETFVQSHAVQGQPNPPVLSDTPMQKPVTLSAMQDL